MAKAALHLLSDAQIKRLKPQATDEMITDGGGLYLFIREYGAKEWVFRYTSPITKKRRKQSLGSYPDMTLKKARDEASEKRVLISKGIDPSTQTENDKEAERERLKTLESNAVETIIYQWKKEELKHRKDKGKETERMFKKDVLPVIGNRNIGSVTRADIKIILDRVLIRKSNRQANALLTELKQFFGYADDEGLITQDPTRRITKARTGGKDKSRDRYLSKKELVLLKKLLPESKLEQYYIHTIYMFLATGCRRLELIHAPLASFSVSDRILNIPPERSKNNTEHNIYLSDFALKQFQAIKKLTKSKVWLLPNIVDDAPITGTALTKLVTDRQPKLLKKKSDRKKLKGRVNNESLKLPNGHWIIHDLRRTTATIMQDLGVMPHVIKRCLNQRTSDKVTETYQRSNMIKEQKQAFVKLGAYLSKILD